jgi:small-conductance mechanosensitive channel
MSDDVAEEWRAATSKVRPHQTSYYAFGADPAHRSIRKPITISVSLRSDYDSMFDGRGPIKATRPDSGYPRYVIMGFAGGVVMFVVGIIILIASIFVSNDNLEIIGAVLTAIGSTTAVVMLLRGQDLDERSR